MTKEGAKKPIAVPADDKLKKDTVSKKGDKKQDAASEELSEEDQQMKDELDLLVQRLQESNTKLYLASLESIRTTIRTATTSMTSVPKPLKFLRPHYASLVEIHTKWANGKERKLLADILSVLSMSFGKEGEQETLKYRLMGMKEDAGLWGHEYIRHLAAEIGKQYTIHVEKEEPTDYLLNLALELTPFFLSHNAEADAVDLLLEIEAIQKIIDFVDENTYSRVCLYLVSCITLLPPPENINVAKTARAIYRKVNKLPEAISLSMQLNDMGLIKEDFESCSDSIIKKQLAFLLARHGVQLEVEDEELNTILSNALVTENFLSLATQLDVLEPKTPEDIYKSHLENIRPGIGGGSVDSAKQNLASTYTNAFVNCGFTTDKLMIVEEGTSWVYKNKDSGMMASSASLGLLYLWDVEKGLNEIDKYLYSNEDYIKAGAFLAIGLSSTGVKDESDPALALLTEHTESNSLIMKIAAIYGLGTAYSGTCREDLAALILPILSDLASNIEVAGISALALGLIFAGSCNGEVASTILQTMMEREEAQLKDPMAKLLCLGLALLFIGKEELADTTIETLKAIEDPIGKQAEILVQVCAYAGTGNVLNIQQLLHICSEHLDKEKENDTHQFYAVIGIALIAMGEDIGSEMSHRTFNHLMHCGEPVIRRAVPLALGLLCASNPIPKVLDTLSKYSHDNDQDVAMNAIFAMGLVGAGTNNARLAQLLRQLASYYHKEPNALFVVRIAQGLVHLGKGTMTINPYHSNRTLMSPVAVSGILTSLIAFSDPKSFIFGKYHILMYSLVCAIKPRFLITMDEDLNSLEVSVRVGQAVDTVGQAGRPKTITGFQTHTTPVLLAYGERAELATEEYLPLSNVLEGFVLLKKNPDWVEEDKQN